MLHALTSISADRRRKASPTSAPAPCLHRKQHLDRARYIIRGEGKRFEGECFLSFVVCKSNHTKCYVHSPRSRIIVRPQHRPQQRSHPVSTTANNTYIRLDVLSAGRGRWVLCLLCCFANEITLLVTCTHLDLESSSDSTAQTTAPPHRTNNQPNQSTASTIEVEQGSKVRNGLELRFFAYVATHLFCPNQLISPLPCSYNPASSSAPIFGTAGRWNEGLISEWMWGESV